MMVSTRGRYALRVLIDMAEHGTDSYVPMKEIVRRQGISKKYMEQIMPVLVKNGLVEGVHGAGGGYRLTKDPLKYTVGDILRLTEGDHAPVACLSCDATPCNRYDKCRTISMWDEFNRITNEYFNGIQLRSLMK